MRIRLRNVTGYWLPKEIEEGQRGTVIGFQDYSVIVRSRGKELTLPALNVDAGMIYQLADGRFVDQDDRRVQKAKARAREHLVQVELFRNLAYVSPPF